MAKNAFANVRGEVIRVDHKDGIGKESGKPYSMDIVTVFVERAGLTEVVLPSVLPADALQALIGETVDFTVEIFRNAHGFGLNVVQNDATVAAYSSGAALQAAS